MAPKPDDTNANMGVLPSDEEINRLHVSASNTWKVYMTWFTFFFHGEFAGFELGSNRKGRNFTKRCSVDSVAILDRSEYDRHNLIDWLGHLQSQDREENEYAP